MRDWLLINFSNDELVDVYRQNGTGVDLLSKFKSRFNSLYITYNEEIWISLNDDAESSNLTLGEFISELITKYDVTTHFDFVDALVKYAVRRHAYEITSNIYTCEKD